MEFINYAHRGASAYAPENTLAAFYLGCSMGANGIETDVQQTKDGVLVLFHDQDMMRIANRPESIHDLTYQELLQIDVGAHKGKAFSGERVPTLDEFLRHFSAKALHFAIEIKELGVEEKTLEMIQHYHCEEKVIITSAMWDSLLRVHALAPQMRLGFLTKQLSRDMLAAAKAEGIFQICPKACILTDEWNDILRQEGFSVRAWGIPDEETMQKMLDLQVDGMTINFPDILVRALQKTQV